jgi:regulation of enolase protein 1 (concanavalin A-like superfamily)
MSSGSSSPWTWLNEPARWELTATGLAFDVEPETDFWQVTHYGFVRDSGHFAALPSQGDFTLRVRFRGAFAEQYDQAGLMVRADAQEWVKCGIERVDGVDRMSVVVTRGARSDWSLHPALGAGDGWYALELRREADALHVSAVPDDGDPVALRLAPLDRDARVGAGVMAAAPTGRGFRVEFADVALT